MNKPVLLACFVLLIASPARAENIMNPNPAPAAAPRVVAPVVAPRPRPLTLTPRPQASTPGAGSNRRFLTAAYERPLIELSESIGSLAFLTTLCAASEQSQNPWQKRMDVLLESEGDSLGIREKLNGAYNQGYLAFSTTYRQCTEAAKAATALLTNEAARLSRAMERRYGN